MVLGLIFGIAMGNMVLGMVFGLISCTKSN